MAESMYQKARNKLQISRIFKIKTILKGRFGASAGCYSVMSFIFIEFSFMSFINCQ